MLEKYSGKEIHIRLTQEMFEKVSEWASIKGISMNQLVMDAIELQIKFYNSNYDLPTLEQARLNQLIQEQQLMRKEVNNLTASVDNLLQVITNLDSGENLLDVFESRD